MPSLSLRANDLCDYETAKLVSRQADSLYQAENGKLLMAAAKRVRAEKADPSQAARTLEKALATISPFKLLSPAQRKQEAIRLAHRIAKNDSLEDLLPLEAYRATLVANRIAPDGKPTSLATVAKNSGLKYLEHRTTPQNLIAMLADMELSRGKKTGVRGEGGDGTFVYLRGIASSDRMVANAVESCWDGGAKRSIMQPQSGKVLIYFRPQILDKIPVDHVSLGWRYGGAPELLTSPPTNMSGYFFSQMMPNNEVAVKGDISLKKTPFLVFAGDSERREVLEGLKKKGIKKINGIPVEEVILPQGQNQNGYY